jgi:Animal haem peroxidase
LPASTIICDRLKIDYPDKNGDWLFEKARLIVAGLIAKIHTIEWAPALLNTPALRFGMRGNWWGILGEEFARA